VANESELNHNQARNLAVDYFSPTSLRSVKFRCFSFTNMLYEEDANSVKTAGLAITALELHECFFYFDGGRKSASIVIGSLKKSENTMNIQVRR
jgi:hypothetical protein